MNLGDELVKEQLFFRKELRERIHWFIRLRWIALLAAVLSVYVLALITPGLPVVPLAVTILAIALANGLFFLAWQRLKSLPPGHVRPFEIFAHIQVGVDLAALFCFIFFTGGIHSPFLTLVIFHIVLAGILLSTASCYAWSGLVVLCFGGLFIMEQTALFPLPFGVPLGISVLPAAEFPGALFYFLILAGFVLVTAFLTTSVKLTLRQKGRELLRVSKELQTSNAKLMTLYDMVREMGSLHDPRKLMDTATRNSVVITGVKGCAIKLFDKKKEKLLFASVFGLSRAYVSGQGVDLEKSPVNLKALSGDSASRAEIDFPHLFEYPENVEREGIASVLSLPLRANRVTLGVISFYSETRHYFDARDLRFYSLVAGLTAMGIDTANREANKTWFLSKAAHQLKSPMNAIHSMLRVVEKGFQGPVSEAQKTTLNRCTARIRLLNDMIQDLLKIGTHRTETDPDTVPGTDVTRVLQTLVDFYSPRALEKQVRLSVHTGRGIPEVRAGLQLLDDLFSNLISNAVKYTPPGGDIRIDLSLEDPDQIRFRITDTGIGIPEKDLSAVFSEFFRSENAKAFTENGTGLGLMIVREALDILKGEVQVESTLGKGTMVTCRFPAGRSPDSS